MTRLTAEELDTLIYCLGNTASQSLLIANDERYRDEKRNKEARYCAKCIALCSKLREMKEELV